MKDFNSIIWDDFYFNGQWLSSFNGQIAGESGLAPFSILPAKEIKTEKVLGIDGEFVYSSSYTPRTFTVPVLFNDISQIRSIAGWLNKRTPADFYFKNDTVKIKVMFDSALDLTAYTLQGIVELKFIAHEPFYYLINDNVQTFTTGLTTPKTVVNSGNVESNPLIKLTGTGNITIAINGVNVTINSVSGYVYIDTMYCTCYKDNSNLIFNYVGDFYQLNSGNNTIQVISGTCTQIDVTPRSRWI